MNPGRFNHEPSGLGLYRSYGPDQRTSVSQGGQPCAAIMNLAGFIMNPLDWCFVRRPQWLGGCPVVMGFKRESRTLPFVAAATGWPGILRP